MNVELILKKFMQKTTAQENICLVCDNKYPDWMSDLQQILEEEGVSLEEFCGGASGSYPTKTFNMPGYPLKVNRGRLMLNCSGNCVHVSDVRALLKRLQTKEHPTS